MTLDGWSDRVPTRSCASLRALLFLLFQALATVICAQASEPSAPVAPPVTSAEANVDSSAIEDADDDSALAELSEVELADLIADEETAAFARAGVLTDEPLPESSGTRFADALDDRDELWFVSARRARITPEGAAGFDVWRYLNRSWVRAGLAELHAADTSIPTCFHVHGNRVSFAQANCGGWNFYTTVTAAGCRERGPLRWVIFTWPSDRCCDVGPRKDVQIKAVRAECYGYYLAWLVDSMPADSSLSMIGYSFGTRVIGSALHLLGGGSLRGRALAERKVERRAIRTVLLAAALDNDHFAPGRAMQCAPSQIDRLLIAMNCRDPALKWYALLYKIVLRPTRGQQSLGYSGIAGLTSIPCLSGRVEHRDLTAAVGREHDAYGFRYLTPTFVERMRQYLYHEPLGAR